MLMAGIQSDDVADATRAKTFYGVRLFSHKIPRANEDEKDEGEQYHENEYGQHQRFM